MATRYLKLYGGVQTGDVLGASDWNKLVQAVDRGGGAVVRELLGQGVLRGWELCAGHSTVSSGAGLVGACLCETAGEQAISGLTAGLVNYVYARTDAGSPAAGTVSFVARTASGPVSNDDGVTQAVLLGKGMCRAGSGLSGIDSSLREDWRIAHGSLGGLEADDHPQYMQEREVHLRPAESLTDYWGGVVVSTFGSELPELVLTYPALSTTAAAWGLCCPTDHSGAVTVYTDWVSAGLPGTVHLELLGRHRGPGDVVDAAPTPIAEAKTVSISGAAGRLWRTSFAWTSAKPQPGEQCTVAIRRDGTAGSDTLSGTARLLGARVVFETAGG